MALGNLIRDLIVECYSGGSIRNFESTDKYVCLDIIEILFTFLPLDEPCRLRRGAAQIACRVLGNITELQC